MRRDLSSRGTVNNWNLWMLQGQHHLELLYRRRGKCSELYGPIKEHTDTAVIWACLSISCFCRVFTTLNNDWIDIAALTAKKDLTWSLRMWLRTNSVIIIRFRQNFKVTVTQKWKLCHTVHNLLTLLSFQPYMTSTIFFCGTHNK